MIGILTFIGAVIFTAIVYGSVIFGLLSFGIALFQTEKLWDKFAIMYSLLGWFVIGVWLARYIS